LVDQISSVLDDLDKSFLLSLNRLEPDWSIYDFEDFPSVKWKMLNLERFKKAKPDKYAQQLKALEDVLRLKLSR